MFYKIINILCLEIYLILKDKFLRIKQNGHKALSNVYEKSLLRSYA